MNHAPIRLRTFILAMSAAVSIGFFGASYYALDRVLNHAVRDNATSAAETLARTTFTGMYQLMSTGWSRVQLEQHLSAVQGSAQGSGATLAFHRGQIVERDYGAVAQPVQDAPVHRVFSQGKAFTEASPDGVRHLMPLIAKGSCLTCHRSAKSGDVLGIIEVRQDFAPLLARSREAFLLWLLAIAPLAMGGAGFAVWRVNRRLEQSIAAVDEAVAEVSRVADLKHVAFARRDLGFVELNQLFARLGDLVTKLRDVAVDKDVLHFEIRLLEKFVITSEVVRDWGDYISRLLTEINTVMPTHVLFSVFHVDEEAFDLEIFWSRPPVSSTREAMEHHVRAVVASDARLGGLAQVSVHHHAPSEGEPLSLDQRTVVLETKTLLLDRPRIGGIVGIGVHASAVDDDTLRLVVESLLSTMINVVGSVKAIHKYTQDMEYYATRDPLTDLYNRRVFWELLEYEVARAGRQGYSFALLVIDLDNFKLVNDGFGHHIGDRYLQTFAHTLRQVLRPGDIFGRYGGDEFVVLLPDIMPDMATEVAQRMLAAASAMRVETGREPLGGSASMGLAVYPLHANNAKDLFLFADNMLYKAKSAGKNQVGAPDTEDIAAAFRDMTETTVMVVNAVNEGRVEPFFQPIMHLREQHIIGYEVLSRLNLDGPPLEAARFIEFAEKAGVIHQLDTQVMEKALRTVAAQQYEGLIFLNLSPRALSLAGFIHTLKRVAGECGVTPERIVFEITERDTIKNLVVLENLVAELKLFGFKLAIDDFGSGFSSFQYLRRLPVDYLKIEGDFIFNLLENDKDRAFVETIQRLAAGLGIQVIAEHVESAEVLNMLREMGVDMAQGYHIGLPGRFLGKPVPH